MLRLFAALAVVVTLAAALPETTHPLYVYGHAAYTYGPLHCTGNPCDVVPSCNTAHWAKDIEAFNSDTSISDASIKTVLSYGGDIEFWPKKGNPTACHEPATDLCNYTSYYDPNNEKAAAVYSKAGGVQQVVALLDSRLDGMTQIKEFDNDDACKFGDFYPNLNNLTKTQIGNLAQQTARLFCKDDNLGGVQIDLEPYADPYKQSLETFIKSMHDEFKDDDGSNGCKTTSHPEGRTVSYFTFAHNTRDDFWKTIMGPNGYFVFSGYDLNPLGGDPSVPEKDTFLYNNVTQFVKNLREEIPEITRAIKGGGKFTMALPIAASCHEYEHYVPMHGEGCGPACQPWNSGHTMDEYVQAAMDVVTSSEWGDLFKIKEGGQFLGLSFWVWTYDMTYPPMKWFNNLFLPATPSTKVLEILKKELPKLEAH
jgi:hypothetical protein